MLCLSFETDKPTADWGDEDFEYCLLPNQGQPRILAARCLGVAMPIGPIDTDRLQLHNRNPREYITTRSSASRSSSYFLLCDAPYQLVVTAKVYNSCFNFTDDILNRLDLRVCDPRSPSRLPARTSTASPRNAGAGSQYSRRRVLWRLRVL